MVFLVALMLVLSIATAAYAATINATNAHDISFTERRFEEGKLPSTCTSANDPDCAGDLTPQATGGADTVWGQGGWDWVQSQAGPDELHGGTGMDQWYANEGQDTVKGDEGHDHLFGGSGADYIDASDGANEPDNVEEVHGYQPKKNETAEADVCVIDVDYEGAIVSHCETLHIQALDNGATHQTPLYMTGQDKDAGNSYATHGPGTYSHVGF